MNIQTKATTPLSALNGLKVIDLSRVLGGPYCTQILADHGAEVLKIEPPNGDETRVWGPPFVEDTASYFLGVNRNKKGLSLNLKQEEDRGFLRKLLKDADVLIENFKPGTMEKWGLGFDTLHKEFPHLIHCSISGFGATGPLGEFPGYDACAQALCGLMSVNGEGTGDATRVGLPIVDMVTGMNAVIAILMAVYERHQSKLGQHLDITLFDSAIALLHPHAPNYFSNGKIPVRTGNAHPNIAPYETFPTKKGDVFLAIGNNRQFELLCEAINCNEFASDTMFATNAERLKNRPLLHKKLSEALSNFEAEELAYDLLKLGVPASPVNNVEDILNHPHTAHRNMIINEGNYKGINTPIKLSRTPAQFRMPPPRHGEHNDEYGL